MKHSVVNVTFRVSMSAESVYEIICRYKAFALELVYVDSQMGVLKSKETVETQEC